MLMLMLLPMMMMRRYLRCCSAALTSPLQTLPAGEVSFYRKCDVIELKAFTAWRELGFDLIAGNHENVILARADAWPTT